LIRNQTNRAIFLDSGRCAFQGSPDDAIAAYLVAESEREHQQSGSAPNVAPVGDGEQLARIEAVHTLDASGQPRSAFHTGQALTVRIDYEAFEPIAKPCFGIAFLTGDGSVYTGTNTAVSGFPIDAIDGRGSVSFALRHLPFVPGLYRIRIALRDGQLASCIAERDVGTLRVEGGRFGAGLFHPEHEWRLGEPE